MHRKRALRHIALLLMVSLGGATSPAWGDHHPASSISETDVIQPAQLVARLKDGTQPAPLVLQVGSHVLYAQAHIEGSYYGGSASTDEGLKALRARVAALPKNAPIVLYCGCCPWSRCPNIAPAYEELHRLGYSNTKALYIVNDFGTNWVDAGYPVAKGE